MSASDRPTLPSGACLPQGPLTVCLVRLGRGATNSRPNVLTTTACDGCSLHLDIVHHPHHERSHRRIHHALCIVDQPAPCPIHRVRVANNVGTPRLIRCAHGSPVRAAATLLKRHMPRTCDALPRAS